MNKLASEPEGRLWRPSPPLQEARIVIDEIALDRSYDHRLMDCNNNLTTTLADIQEALRIQRASSR